ncbi:MAG TPA: hypothetical protein VFR47_22425, partial [Anaerolineales bacterium]|nr:hypothetical protein [Anaerolineales bacterium]
RSYQQYFNCRYSVFFWHLLLLEQMTKEVPGIRPTVISTETRTRLDEYRPYGLKTSSTEETKNKYTGFSSIYEQKSKLTMLEI